MESVHQSSVHVCSYYINRVKDVYRQATIDLLLGNASASELTLLRNAVGRLDAAADEDDGQVLVEKEENLKTLIDECKKMLITEPEECLGGWGLIDCDPVTGDPAQQDMDIILLLSQKAYYVARYCRRNLLHFACSAILFCAIYMQSFSFRGCGLITKNSEETNIVYMCVCM